MSKEKKNELVVLYNDVEQKEEYRLNGVDVTETMELIKDRWEREIIDNKCKLFQLDMGVINQKITDLEAKLAEKEKNLHYKNCECEKWKADYENCSKLEKMMTKEHQYCLDNWRASEQDKISFAIEKLEKVKDYFIEGYAVCKNFSDFYWNFTEQIDNQIAELTHQQDKGE